MSDGRHGQQSLPETMSNRGKRPSCYWAKSSMSSPRPRRLVTRLGYTVALAKIGRDCTPDFPKELDP